MQLEINLHLISKCWKIIIPLYFVLVRLHFDYIRLWEELVETGIDASKVH